MKIWDKKVGGVVEFTPSPIGKIVAGSKIFPANRAERRRVMGEERRLIHHAQRHQLPRIQEETQGDSQEE